MTLTKKTMVSDIARRTQLPMTEVHSVLECLLEIWTDELRSGGRIELENFFVLDTYVRGRSDAKSVTPNELSISSKNDKRRRLTLRTSKQLRRIVNE